MLLAKDSNGLTKGAAYIVWDENSVYYLAGGVSTEGKNEGIMQLLLWEAIKFSSSMNLAFDFEGSMIESIERFFRSFGPQQKPYFAISKVNSKKITIIESLKSIKKVLSSDKISPNRSENDA